MKAWTRGLAILAGLAALAPHGGRAGAPGLPPAIEDVATLEAFLDGAIGEHRARAGTPGVVVVVVKDGKVLVAKGYGHADLERRREVDPATTVWRVGSIAKVVTATAVWQQIEAGRLGLEDDVNRHLDGWRVEDAFGVPVTLGSLLTHTSGFDLALEAIAARPGEAPEPLGAWLRRTMPRRVRPPGEVFQYSNHGTALAAHLVERVTGMAFEDYVRERIFAPLGMRSASLSHRPEHEGVLALGYAWDYLAGHPVALPRYEFQFGPAAGLRATALDMVPFLRAHLEGGAVDGARILRPETLAEMHRVRFAHHPELPGLAAGLFAGPRGLGHAGGSLPHLSSLVLLPRAGVGIFFSSNALSGAGLFATLQDQLLQRYYPRPEAVPWGELPAPDGALARFEGRYRYVQLPAAGPARLAAALLPIFPEVTVAQVAPGVLAIRHGLRRVDLRVRQTGPLVFAREDGEGVVAFHEVDGEVRRLCLRAFLPLALERIAWWEGRSLALACLLAFGAGFAWLGLGRPVWWAWGRVRGAPPWPGGIAYTIQGAAGLAFLGLLATPLAAVFPLVAGLPALVVGRPALLAGLIVGGRVGAGLALLGPIVARRAVRDPDMASGSRAGLVAGAAGLLGFLPWARYWGLL